ncbi:hypothetical protein MMC14_007385 [Varicellaria rhodocarpa]|nr:hypothetical protein [Varicellaria rhodocarpa]
MVQKTLKLFAWDDETDSTELSSIFLDFDSAQNFRIRTLTFVRQCLGFDAPSNAKKNSEEISIESNPIITNFSSVGQSIIQAYTVEQCECLLQEIEFFLEMSAVEQRLSLGDTLPSVEDYVKRRMGTSAVAVCIAITEYCFGMELPRSIMQSSDMKRLWDETNIIIFIVNDILSVHKEVAQGQVDSLIPLLFRQHGAAQLAIDKAIVILKNAVASFDQAARILLARYTQDDITATCLGQFIEGCRYACTANLNWR